MLQDTANINVVCATPADLKIMQSIWCQAYAGVLGLPYTGMFVQLLSLQFKAKQQQFAHDYPSLKSKLITYANTKCGYICFAYQNDTYYLVDIALLPHHQHFGIGKIVLTSSLQDAAKRVEFAKLSVSKSNPAFTLYQNLGFELASEDDTHYHMKTALKKYQTG
jgi:ribosomal protein S18 acetylase RimI-like enzyme